jgi:hypothetical protein
VHEGFDSLFISDKGDFQKTLEDYCPDLIIVDTCYYPYDYSDNLFTSTAITNIPLIINTEICGAEMTDCIFLKSFAMKDLLNRISQYLNDKKRSLTNFKF